MNFNKTPELLAIAITVAAVLSTFSVGAISANAAAPASFRQVFWLSAVLPAMQSARSCW
jgi:hypothetical protein